VGCIKITILSTFMGGDVMYREHTVNVPVSTSLVQVHNVMASYRSISAVGAKFTNDRAHTLAKLCDRSSEDSFICTGTLMEQT
jgi:hypothetical protein